MAISHVFFDLDGTLTNPVEGITRCFAHALERMGREVPPRGILASQIGPPSREVIRNLLGTADRSSIEAGLRIYRERFAEVGLFENTVYPGIPRLLDRLRRRGRTLIVATSKPEIYAKRILAHFGLEDYFTAVRGPDLEGNLAKKDELLGMLLREHPVEPSSCVMVGDRNIDVLAARGNGMIPVGVTYGYGTRDELERAGATHVCDSVEELGKLLL